MDLAGHVQQQSDNTLEDGGRSVVEAPVAAATGLLSYFSGPAMLAFSSVVAATAYYYKTRPRPEQPAVPLDSQSPILVGPERVHVSKMFESDERQSDEKDVAGKSSGNAIAAGYLKYFSEDAQTLYQLFRKGLVTSEHKRCLGWRPSPTAAEYHWMTYREALTRAQHFGAGLKSFGLSKYSLVGIYAQNCPEWVIFEQAAYCHSLVVVPLYDTLGKDACQFIVRQTEMAVVVVENEEKAHLLMDQSEGIVRRIIVIRPKEPAPGQPDALTKRAEHLRIELYSFADVEELGRQHMDSVREDPPSPDDLATICYTSGTTGNPKGVMLTHRNVVAGCCSVLLQLGAHRPRADDVMMSFLPLAHMLERCCENAVYYVGGAVGFYSGDIKQLSGDLQALRPTIMPAVPRLLNRVYDKIHGEVAQSAAKKFLFDMAYNSKKKDLDRGIVRKNTIWDRLVFRKVQDAFGGDLRLIVVGSAPLAGNVLTFMRVALGCMISEGYGQTEATAPISLTVSGDFTPEHVGPPVACNAIKLVDVPEMEYYAASNQGEVCVKGSNVFVGYFREPELTQSVMDVDGWLHTGDIGMWLPNGTLKIIDRRKHIFKLSQGEYIVPEKIESVYLRSLYVEQVFVYGESLKSSIVAIVVPDEAVLMRWAATAGGMPEASLRTLCEDARVKAMVLTDLLIKGKEGGLKPFEQVKDIYIHWDLFSVENGLLTPTFKSKRNEIQKHFRSELDAMYQKLD